MSVADPAPVLELIDAFRRSKTMSAAVSLGVFEQLDGVYVNQPVAETSCATVSLTGYVLYSNEALFPNVGAPGGCHS